MDSGFEIVYRARNEAVANIVRASLEDAGIPAVIRPHHSSWFDGAFVPAEGAWGDVLVPSEHLERACALLAESAQTGADEEEELS